MQSIKLILIGLLSTLAIAVNLFFVDTVLGGIVLVFNIMAIAFSYYGVKRWKLPYSAIPIVPSALVVFYLLIILGSFPSSGIINYSGMGASLLAIAANYLLLFVSASGTLAAALLFLDTRKYHFWKIFSIFAFGSFLIVLFISMKLIFNP